MSEEYQLWFEDELVKSGSFGNVSITVIHGMMGLDYFETLHRHQSELKARRGFEKLTAFSIVANIGKMSTPDKEFRDAAAKLELQWCDKMVADARVIEGSGFRASFARAIFSGVQLISRTPLPTEVFSDRIEAARWIANREGQWPGLAPLEEKFVEVIRAL